MYGPLWHQDPLHIRLFHLHYQKWTTIDPQPNNGTSMFIQHMITLLKFFLKNAYFLFQGKYFEQVHGAAMGSINPVVANLFME